MLISAGAIAIGDYTEAAAVVVLFGLAEWLETRATGRARDAIAAVLALKPETAVLAATGVLDLFSNQCLHSETNQTDSSWRGGQLVAELWMPPPPCWQ